MHFCAARCTIIRTDIAPFEGKDLVYMILTDEVTQSVMSSVNFQCKNGLLFLVMVGVQNWIQF